MCRFSISCRPSQQVISASNRFNKARRQTQSVCKHFVQLTLEGWPEKKSLPRELRPYHTVCSEVAVAEGVLMRGNRIVIPLSLHQVILKRLHTGHQGINKCRDMGRRSVWWPGLAAELEKLVMNSDTHRPPVTQPLTLPGQKVSTDLFDYNLLIVDYYIKIALLSNTSSTTAIQYFCLPFMAFQRSWCLTTACSSMQYKQFTKDYCFKHVTSSPYYPQGNGEVQRSV